MRFRKLVQPVVLIPLLAFFARILPGPRTIDDAYITFRYAQNLLSNQGFVYNPGEAVLGTTTPLFALILTLIGAVLGTAEAFPIIAPILSALADAIACFLLIRTCSNFPKKQKSPETPVSLIQCMDLYESHKGSLRGFVYVSTWFFLTEELYIQSATIFHFAPLTSNYALYSN